MITKRRALCLGTLFVVLFSAACAPTAAPSASDGGEASYSYAPADAESEAPAAAPAYPSGNEPYDMFFEDYGVNPSVDTEDDQLSTFALDVDTGSYSIMRSYLTDGFLPPSDSVRVEEYVNYFDQGYPDPPEHQAFGLYVDGGPAPFTETERYQILRVGIQGYEVPEEVRKDASLVFVIDVSGSMDMDNRLGLVKRSLELLVERLRPTDQVGIVVYGSNARVALEPTPGWDTGTILRAIRRLEPEGATNAEAGIRLGYRMAMQQFMPGGINRIILCSDGVANVGLTGPDQILDDVRGYVEEGVTLTTIGFGMDNYNDVLMEQLADDGDGFYAYVDDMDEAERLFLDNLTGTLQTIALDAKVQVEFNPETVARYRLIGFENRAVADDDFRDNEVDAGEIGAGHSVTALYEVKLFPGASGQVATVSMRWEDPDTHAVTELSRDLQTSDLAESFSEADPYFQRDVVVAEYAEVLRESYWADESTLAGIYWEAERIGELLDRDDDMREFISLVNQARLLHDCRVEPYCEGVRK